MGSKDEKTLFKVRLLFENPSRNLYYDSPEEYERHFMTTVKSDVKQKWIKRTVV
jgi:hypothetical protein